jgi:hypothetical protein
MRRSYRAVVARDYAELWTIGYFATVKYATWWMREVFFLLASFSKKTAEPMQKERDERARRERCSFKLVEGNNECHQMLPF